MKTKVFVRADGNSKTGLGHLVRSLALVEMLREHFECVFMSKSLPSEFLVQVNQTCKDFILIPEVFTISEEIDLLLKEIDPKSILVLDGYSFDTDYQKAFKKSEILIVCIDDIFNYHFTSDVVINHAGGIQVNEYSIEKYTQLYLGPKYALLRTSFLNQQAQTKSVPESADTIFICLGGVDKRDYTLKVLTAVLKVKAVKKIFIVVGVAYEHFASLLMASELIKEKEVIVKRGINSAELVEILKECHLAIVSASTVSYEVCSVKAGVISGFYVNNQLRLNEFLKKTGMAYSIGSFEEIEINELSTFISETLLSSKINFNIESQKKYFDGAQKERMLKLFTELSVEFTLSIRKAEERDAFITYNWFKDPAVRSFALNPDIVSFEEHNNWFVKRIKSTSCWYYIFELDGKPLGQVRFDFDGESFVISYAVDRVFRGRGFGSLVLRKAIKKLALEVPGPTPLKASVVKGNTASSKIFMKNNFTKKKEFQKGNFIVEEYFK